MSTLQISRPAPDWNGMALVDRDFRPLALADYRGKWVALVFYPLDFTFVCPTELVGLNDKYAEFQKRNCEVIAASTDSVYSHLGWVKADDRLGALKYPLLSDFTKQIARDYGVLIEEEGLALRGTFLIDDTGVLRFMSVNDLGTGRNIDEILRTLDALQTGQMCPCNWQPGDATIPE